MTKTYTIKGREYTQFDLNKRCAELLGLEVRYTVALEDTESALIGCGISDYWFNPCVNPKDTLPIIKECWDGLNSQALDERGIGTMKWITVWQQLMIRHNCDQLTSACIYYLEQNDA